MSKSMLEMSNGGVLNRRIEREEKLRVIRIKVYIYTTSMSVNNQLI